MKERHRDVRGLRFVETMAQDFLLAARSMKKYPVACLVAVLSLAGGIGSAAATLTVRDIFFMSPPRLYQEPSGLSRIHIDRPDRSRGSIPPALYALWNDDLQLRRAMAATRSSGQKEMRTEDRREAVPVRSVTTNGFSILGVNPVLGRAFTAEDIADDRSKPAILGYRVWQVSFGGRQDVLGKIIRLDDEEYTVIGVMPEGFWFTAMESPIWLPLDPERLRSDELLAVMVRREAGITHEALADRLSAALERYTVSLPAAERNLRARAVAVVGSPLTDQISPVVLWLIGAAVFLTLLIACTNVAVLVIAQWTAREREIAIRASLGGSRSRIVRLLLAESVLIAVCGGTLALAVALAIRGVILNDASGSGNFFDAGIRPMIFFQTAAITIISGIAAGLAPALYETRRLHENPLRLIPDDRIRQRWRHSLVVLEITVTVALLVVVGAIVSGYQRHMSANFGYDPAPLVSVRVESDGGVRIKEIAGHLNELPGVTAVAPSNGGPLPAATVEEAVATDSAGSKSLISEKALVGADFFTALNVPLIRGRSFSGVDATGGARFAIVNELLATALFPGGDPVGSSIWNDGVAHQIIGVVKNYSFPLHRPRPTLFLPLSESTDAKRTHFLLRVSGDPAAIVPILREEIRRIAPDHTVPYANAVQDIINIGGREILSTVFLMAPLIAIGMLLTAAGIYSVLAFAVTRRAKELAVRAAVGATGKDLMWLVTRHSFRLVAVGTILGVSATFALTRFAQGMGGVFDSPAWQAFVFPVVIVALVGALAAWIPCRRALGVNPAQLLRSD